MRSKNTENLPAINTPVWPTRWSYSGSWGSHQTLREAGPRPSTHSRVGGDTSRFVALVVGASRRGPDTPGRRSLARRSKMLLLYTSTTDTSTFRLLDGFSEISLGGGTRGTQPLRNLGPTVRRAAGEAVSGEATVPALQRDSGRRAPAGTDACQHGRGGGPVLVRLRRGYRLGNSAFSEPYLDQ